MKKYYNEKLFQLEEKLNEISLEIDDPIFLSETAIKIILDSLTGLRKFILERKFRNEEEEVYFFKNLKPKIVSKLIYYNAIYKIETKMPFGGEEAVRISLNNELQRLKLFFDNNREFYKYYRTNSTYLDHKYFVRGKYDVKLCLDTYYFETDHNFSTSHDYKVAKIIANDLIQLYIEDQLAKLSKNKIENKDNERPHLTWTGSKAGLIELIYALQIHGTFDNGKVDIKFLCKFFEREFHIDLGDFYHTYLEIRNRKINRTKFIDTLRDGLIKKMDEQDEK